VLLLLGDLLSAGMPAQRQTADAVLILEHAMLSEGLK
jgi:hypothetical protein